MSWWLIGRRTAGRRRRYSVGGVALSALGLGVLLVPLVAWLLRWLRGG